MEIIPLPLLSDNYAWLLTREGTRECAVVDPSEAAPVAAAIAERKLELKWILATHHHPDHIGGIKELAGPGVEVVASEYDKDRIPCLTRLVGENARFGVLGCEVQCFLVPGHTLGAVAYYMPEANAVFTGDTLFTAGCGRLFEGDAGQMHVSLHKLGSLPERTLVYCGHEYTEKNLRFALSLEPRSVAIAQRLEEAMAQRLRQAPTVPAPLAVELQTNPFLRADSATMAKLTGESGGVAVFAELRRRRDSF